MIHQLRSSLLCTPEIIVQTWRTAWTEGLAEADVRDAVDRFNELWDGRFPAEQARIVQLLVERVEVSQDGADIRLRIDGLTTLMTDVHTGAQVA